MHTVNGSACQLSVLTKVCPKLLFPRVARAQFFCFRAWLFCFVDLSRLFCVKMFRKVCKTARNCVKKCAQSPKNTGFAQIFHVFLGSAQSFLDPTLSEQIYLYYHSHLCRRSLCALRLLKLRFSTGQYFPDAITGDHHRREIVYFWRCFSS